MNTLKTSSHFFAVFGLLSWAIFQLTKKTINWPGFIAKNIEYISFGSITLSVILTLLYYFITKDRKKLNEFILSMLLLIILFIVFYYFTK